MSKAIQILYEDNHVIVCVKPPGVLSQPGAKPIDDMLTLLKAHVKAKYQKPGAVFLGLVHRLDLNVGGVMVFARTSKAARRLFQTIKNGDFHKTYLAVAEGIIAEAEGRVWIDQLVKDETRRKSVASDDDQAKTSSLSFTVIARANIGRIPVSLVKVELATGRFHQIWSQFSLRNHPLVGDRKYGSQVESENQQLCLWAFRLEFTHPVTGQTMVFRSEPEGKCYAIFAEDWKNIQ